VHPLGTGPTLPPIATSPQGIQAVTSPSPIGNPNESVFGTGFESLFGS
jgi:twitching motility protein PilT